METDMKITVIALSYVGLANAIVLAERGFEVVAYDKDAEKATKLENGEPSFEEKGLSDALKKNCKRITFTTDEKEAYEASPIVFVAVDTPSGADGSADLTHLQEVVACIKKYAKEETFVVIRSTVPVGTNQTLNEAASKSEKKIHFISNPEFMAEGRALMDERSPSRIVIGTSNKEARDLMRRLYAKPISEGAPYYEMDGASAELTKYASNLFLSLKISYINEVARLAEPLGADISAVALAMGADPRIGHSMLHAGVGFGGACLPKDGAAFAKIAHDQGLRLSLVEDTLAINQTQPFFLYQKIVKKMGPLSGKKVAVLGLTFKAGTSDVRHSAAEFFAKSLLADGAIVSSYDPSVTARDSFAKQIPPSDKYLSSNILQEALTDADALVILTEAPEFASLDEAELCSLMKGRVIFDGRNLYDIRHFSFFDYISIGRPERKHE